jgi:DNA-binding transcriptional ArsR family regulator
MISETLPRPTEPSLIFRAFGDPTRLAMFERIVRDGEQSVHALTREAQVSQPAVSKHLAILLRAGLVRRRHTGRETFYSADPSGMAPLIDWTSQMASFWERRFDHLEDLLKRMDQ